LRRDQALLLLKELKAEFHSIESTNYVLLKNEERVGFWELRIQWNPQPEEKTKLPKLLGKHNLEALFSDGYAIFRRTK